MGAGARVLGVDLGAARCGLAVGGEVGATAVPVGVVTVGDGAEWPRAGRLADRLAEQARERGCAAVVVGLPRSLDGAEREPARRARAVADALAARGLAVALADERLTTVAAERAGGGDAEAAALVLRGWLEAGRPGLRAGEQGGAER